MAAATVLTRLTTPAWFDVYRPPVLAAMDAGTDLAVVTLLDRSIPGEARRMVVTLRGLRSDRTRPFGEAVPVHVRIGA